MGAGESLSITHSLNNCKDALSSEDGAGKYSGGYRC